MLDKDYMDTGNTPYRSCFVPKYIDYLNSISDEKTYAKLLSKGALEADNDWSPEDPDRQLIIDHKKRIDQEG